MTNDNHAYPHTRTQSAGLAWEGDGSFPLLGILAAIAAVGVRVATSSPWPPWPSRSATWRYTWSRDVTVDEPSEVVSCGRDMTNCSKPQ